MTVTGWAQIVFYLVMLLALVKPLGAFMARVYQGERTLLDPLLGPVERTIYRMVGISPEQEMSWQTYALALLVFNGLGLVVVFGLQLAQNRLPLNLQHMGPVTPDQAFNTAGVFQGFFHEQRPGLSHAVRPSIRAL